MENVSIVGIDLAKQSVQLHGAATDGSVVFRKKLSRPRLAAFLSSFQGALLRLRLALHLIIGGVRSASLSLRRVLSYLFTLSCLYQ